MHYKRQLIDNLYYIGGNDRRLSRFENMFTLPEEFLTTLIYC